jgi:hypothetical protein
VLGVGQLQARQRTRAARQIQDIHGSPGLGSTRIQRQSTDTTVLRVVNCFSADGEIHSPAVPLHAFAPAWFALLLGRIFPVRGLGRLFPFVFSLRVPIRWFGLFLDIARSAIAFLPRALGLGGPPCQGGSLRGGRELFWEFWFSRSRASLSSSASTTISRSLACAASDAT